MNTHSVPFAHPTMPQSVPTDLELVPAATLTFASVNMGASPEENTTSPMTFQIGKVAVLGAGTMGARIAAHLANAGVPSYLLDIVPPDADGPARNKFAQAGLDGAVKSKPAAFYTPEYARLVTIGNFDDNLDWLAQCDWIIE